MCLSKGSTRNPVGCAFLREIYYEMAIHNISIVNHDIKFEHNVLHDEDFALVVAEIILDGDHHLLAPYYNWCPHVSSNAFSFLFLYSIRRKFWIQSFPYT